MKEPQLAMIGLDAWIEGDPGVGLSSKEDGCISCSSPYEHFDYCDGWCQCSCHKEKR